jgi:hypothetical protein
MLENMNANAWAQLLCNRFPLRAFDNLVDREVFPIRVLTVKQDNRNPDFISHFHSHPLCRSHLNLQMFVYMYIHWSPGVENRTECE